MSDFMQAEVTDKQDWITVDGPQGGESFPADLVGACVVAQIKVWATERVVGASLPAEIADAIRDYCQNSTVWTVTVEHGYGVRLSAPGYLDCTDWTVYTNKREALRAARELESDE